MRNYKSPSIHRTPTYRAKASYYGMQARCLNHNGKNPTYAKVELKMSREEWLDWAIPQYDAFAREFPNQTPMEQSGKGEYQADNDGNKKCSCCKHVSDTDNFHKNRSRRDGFATYCKDCMREHHKERAKKIQTRS